MSRQYQMTVEISGYRPQRAGAIQQAAGAEWKFTDWHEQEGTLTAWAEGSLCGGRSEEQFAERLSMAVWRANGVYCEVTVRATCLEDLPGQTHCLSQSDYVRLVGGPPGKQDAGGPGG